MWWTRAGRAGHFLEGAALVYVRCLPHARGGGKGSFIAAGVPGEPPRAFALAFDSPREAVTEWQWIRCGAPRALRFCKPRLLWTLFTKLGQDLESIHKAFEKEHGPTLYVFELAVHPDKQGRGWGTIVLKELMGQADAMGRWMYLEASSEGSRRLYLRHGFQVSETHRDSPRL